MSPTAASLGVHSGQTVVHGESQSYANSIKSNLNTQPKTPSNLNAGVNSARRRRQPNLIGKSNANLGIKAARDLIKKKYFYVGNLDISCNVESFSSHLESIGVSTLKCNLSTSKFKNTKAFHVCIDEKYVKTFTNAENWPQHVVIREWFFKPKVISADQETGNGPVSTDASVFSSQNDATHLINLHVEHDNDITDQSTIDHNGVTQQ